MKNYICSIYKPYRLSFLHINNFTFYIFNFTFIYRALSDKYEFEAIVG